MKTDHDMRDPHLARKELLRLHELGLRTEYLAHLCDAGEDVLRAIRSGRRKRIRDYTLGKILWMAHQLDEGQIIPPLGAYYPAPNDMVCSNGHLVETWNRYYNKTKGRYQCRTCENARHNRYRWRLGAVRTASEEPIDMSIIKSLSTLRHYGWKWSGTEPNLIKAEKPCDGVLYVYCRCTPAPCGLIATISFECTIHGDMKIGNAKQVHWAKDCPAE